jgi:DNA mismatch repair ATPase MutS
MALHAVADGREIMDVVKVGGQDVALDPKHLEFNEANLTKYMAEFGSVYNYYAQKTADAENCLEKAERFHELRYQEAFQEIKAEGGSDKGADAKAKIHPEVKALYEYVVNFQAVVRKLKAYLKALDKCHENAQSLGHFLRKEMDKLMGSWPKPPDDIADIIAELQEKGK